MSKLKNAICFFALGGGLLFTPTSLYATDAASLIDIVEFNLPQSFVVLCEKDLPPPKLVLRIIENGHKLSNEIDAVDLKKIDNMTRDELGLPSNDLFSFSTTTFKNQIAYKASGATLVLEGGEQNSGVVCVAPVISVDLIINAPQIDIAIDVPKGSCAEGALFSHELKHIGLNKRNMNDMTASIKNHIVGRIGKEQILYGTPQGVSSFIDGDLKREVIELFRANDMVMASRQASLDSGAEMNRLLDTCNGELRKLSKRLTDVLN